MMKNSDENEVEMTSALNRKRRSLIDLTLRNQQFMRIAPLCIGAIVNAVLAIFNGVVGFSQSSLWEQSMAVYFAILCFMGSYVAACSIKPERHSERNICKFGLTNLQAIKSSLELGLRVQSRHTF